MKIRDVAHAAGVSTATVSRALSKPELLSEHMREKVSAAITATGYRVNRAARNLRRQQAGAILVLVPDLGNPFFSQILSGISDGFNDSDYSVLISDSLKLDEPGEALLGAFLDRRIDGVISLDGQLQIEDLEYLKQEGFAKRMVLACEWIEGSQLPSVRSDNINGARLAVQHLYDLGHRKIAHITGPQDNVLTHARRQGMVQERQRLNLPVRDEWIIRGDFSLHSGFLAASNIASMADRPSAIFCASDQVAFGLIGGLCEHGLKVPDDISVIGFDDIELAAYYHPALTTIRQNRQLLGQRAAGLLLQQLRADAEPKSLPSEIIGVDLIHRQSTRTIGI